LVWDNSSLVDEPEFYAASNYMVERGGIFRNIYRELLDSPEFKRQGAGHRALPVTEQLRKSEQV